MACFSSPLIFDRNMYGYQVHCVLHAGNAADSGVTVVVNSTQKKQSITVCNMLSS